MAEHKDIPELQKLAAEFPRRRTQFVRDVEAATIYVADLAKQMAPAIGEVSIVELKEIMVREFREKLIK